MVLTDLKNNKKNKPSAAFSKTFKLESKVAGYWFRSRVWFRKFCRFCGIQVPARFRFSSHPGEKTLWIKKRNAFWEKMIQSLYPVIRGRQCTTQYHRQPTLCGRLVVAVGTMMTINSKSWIIVFLPFFDVWFPEEATPVELSWCVIVGRRWEGVCLFEAAFCIWSIYTGASLSVRVETLSSLRGEDAGRGRPERGIEVINIRVAIYLIIIIK